MSGLNGSWADGGAEGCQPVWRERDGRLVGHGVARRALVRAAVIGLPGVALAACGLSAGQEQAPAVSKTPVTLSFLSWRPIAMDQFEPAWTAYGQKNNVKLDVDKSGDGNQEKLTTMMAANTAPDLFDANTTFLPKQYDGGAVLQIDKYLSRDKITLDKDWALLGIERWRQKTYGVPYWSEPFSIFYNKSLFRQKGVEDPWTRTTNQGDWTIEQMVEAARKINDPANDIYGLDWGQTDMYGIGPLIWTLGVSHLQYDPNIGFMLQLPEVVDAVNTAIDWAMRQRFTVNALTPEAAASRERLQGGKPGIATSGGTNLFATGKVGIHWRSVNDWRRMWPIVGTAFEWDMLPVPSIKGKPGGTYAAGHPLNASSQTKHPEEAWAFMRWMIQDEFQGFLAENQYLVPAKKSHQLRFFRAPAQYPNQHAQVFANVFKRPYGIIFTHFRAGENATTWGQEMPKIIRGEVAVAGGLKNLEGLLNQQIEYGGGENPFKGVRWPMQPK